MPKVAASGAGPALSRDPRCADAGRQPLATGVGAIVTRIFTFGGLQWFLSVCLAGLLIGLGAPFWFDLARSLTRGARVRGGTGQPEPPPAAPAATSGGNSPPRTPVDAFTNAIAAARPLVRRALLTPDGRPYRGAAA